MGTDATFNEVRIDRRGPVRWITIDREARRNALNEAVVTAIDAAIASAQDDDACRAIVLTGAGEKAFCAGADLARDAEGFAFAVDHARPLHYMVRLFRTMQASRVPIIARVNGAAMAGGFGLLCSCDMAIVADDAIMGTPEVKIGLAPMMILPAMMRVVPPRKLMEMLVTGESLSAGEALEIGVVNYVVPRGELDAKLDWLIARIVDKSPTGVRLGKQGYNAMRDMAATEALEFAQVMVAAMSSTADAREGLAAFAEKRSPNWTGN